MPAEQGRGWTNCQTQIRLTIRTAIHIYGHVWTPWVILICSNITMVCTLNEIFSKRVCEISFTHNTETNYEKQPITEIIIAVLDVQLRSRLLLKTAEYHWPYIWSPIQLVVTLSNNYYFCSHFARVWYISVEYCIRLEPRLGTEARMAELRAQPIDCRCAMRCLYVQFLAKSRCLRH